MAKTPDSAERRAAGAVGSGIADYRGLDALLEGCQVIGFDWRYRYVNRALVAQSRRTREQLLGSTMMEVYPGIDRTPLFELLRDCMRRRTSHSLENEFEFPDGSRGWFDLRIQPVPDGVLILSLDITERRRSEEDRARLEAQLRQAQKMEAIGRLAGSIAHDFNNLLAVVHGFAELALERLPDPHPLRGDVDEIVRAADSGARLTRQLLAFSRHQVLSVRSLDLNAVVHALEAMARRLLGADVALSLRLDPDLGAVRADAHQIEQVILNLIVNARDAMPEGGKLSIETSNAELDTAYAEHHAGVEPGLYVVLSVTDDGVGMDAATLERVFEPFFSTKEEGRGTGLGLASVYGIVRQCAGHVFVYSEPGHGSVFRIYLPRETQPAEKAPPPRRPNLLHTGDETVLVVEDQPALRSLIERILRSAGYTVLVTADGAEAIRACAAHAPSIHLVLADVVLPELGGTELAASLRRLKPDLRVLFMSGYAQHVAVERGLVDDAEAFLGKPFGAAELTAAVRAVLDS